MSIKVTVWNEYFHEKTKPEIREVYPEGIHGRIAAVLGEEKDFEIRTATLDMPSHGLTDEVLEDTDVLIWWGHAKHADVQDEIAEKVKRRVLEGMGLIVLHSGHMSKPFLKLMGTGGRLKWNVLGAKERLWVIEPGHPIADGLPEYFELEHEETYGEHFQVPAPDELVFASWFSSGEVFRSGCCYKRGYGKVFYFRPGHEEYPTYFNEHVGHVIKNAVRWAKPGNITKPSLGKFEPLEKI